MIYQGESRMTGVLRCSVLYGQVKEKKENGNSWTEKQAEVASVFVGKATQR